MSAKYSQSGLCDEPLKVVVEGRAVVLLGPSGVSLAMTAEAAKRSAELLKEAAERAIS